MNTFMAQLVKVLKKIGSSRKMTVTQELLIVALTASMGASLGFGGGAFVVDWDDHPNGTCVFVTFENRPNTKTDDIHTMWCSDGSVESWR